MKLFHTHKFGKVQADNFQYCTDCGASKPAPNPCANGHLFEEHSQSNITNLYGKTQSVQNLKCSRCGEMRQFNLTTGLYTR